MWVFLTIFKLCIPVLWSPFGSITTITWTLPVLLRYLDWSFKFNCYVETRTSCYVMLFRFLNITVIYSKYCNNLRQYSVGGNMQNMGIRRKITIITDYINNPSFASSFPPAALFVQDKKFAFESIWKVLINIVTIIFNVITRMFYILRPRSLLMFFKKQHFWVFCFGMKVI